MLTGAEYSSQLARNTEVYTEEELKTSAAPGWASSSSTAAGGSWRRTTAPAICCGPATV